MSSGPSALVVIERHSRTVLAGLTRNAGGPVPPVRELTGDAFDVTVDETLFSAVPAASLEVAEVTATETDIRQCAGKEAKRDGASTVLSPAVSSFTEVTWDDSEETLTVGVSSDADGLTVMYGTGQQVHRPGNVPKGQSVKLLITGATLPIVVLAPGFQPRAVAGGGGE